MPSTDRRILMQCLAAFAVCPDIIRGDSLISIRLGDAVVELAITERNPRDITFLNVHENEQTSVQAAHQFIETHGGKLIELKAQGRRLVSFNLKETRHAFDPNRIFTTAGLEKTLHQYGAYSLAAQDAVVNLRQRLVTTLRNGRTPIVAVHNNAVDGLSIENYKPGADMEHESARVFIDPKANPHDFFLVLDAKLFESLKKAGFNVVQQSVSPTDDGSMSIFCQNLQIPYVNVEALNGHIKEQVYMLETVSKILRHFASTSKSSTRPK